jgi:hypothetical protein
MEGGREGIEGAWRPHAHVFRSLGLTPSPPL